MAARVGELPDEFKPIDRIGKEPRRGRLGLNLFEREGPTRDGDYACLGRDRGVCQRQYNFNITVAGRCVLEESFDWMLTARWPC